MKKLRIISRMKRRKRLTKEDIMRIKQAWDRIGFYPKVFNTAIIFGDYWDAARQRYSPREDRPNLSASTT